MKQRSGINLAPNAAQRLGSVDLSFTDKLSREEFEFFQSLAMKHAGISLPSYKVNMVHRRVSKRLDALRLSNFADYIELLSGAEGVDELEFFINAITTNKTEFFREAHHFQHLQNTFLPQHIRESDALGSSRLRIWSAGCSSGQEPYTIALVLASSIGDVARRDVRVLATDIDTDMLQRGRNGVYGDDDLRRLPRSLRQRFVEELPGGQGRLKEAVRALVTFNQLNLHDTWPMKGQFDAVFCRNVIIYFDKATQIQLFDRFAKQLVTGGFLYIGHSESLYRVSDRFVPEGPGIYRKIM